MTDLSSLFVLLERLRDSNLVGVDPLLGGKDVVCGSSTLSDVTCVSGGEHQWFFRAENSEHILDESTNFVGLAFFFVIDVLEVRNGVHDL